MSTPTVPGADGAQPTAVGTDGIPSPAVSAAPASGGYALEARGIVKSFEGVHALKGVDLGVRPGEIHALLGENGAGKSTLIKIITGVYGQDEGDVVRDGEVVHLHGVKDGHAHGIVALYQELSIVPNVSVAENILLGERLPSRNGLVNRAELRTQAQAQLDRVGQGHIALKKMAGRLSPVEQTMVAVARALAANARVLILDEPTASLTDREIPGLFKVLRQLRSEGVAIIYVSHRLEEVFQLCDRLTVMRDGRTIITKDVADTHVGEVITNMVGREQTSLFPERGTDTGRPALVVEGLSGWRVDNVSFTANAGEVVGIGGLAGSGRSELLRLLSGAQKSTAGTVTVGDKRHPMAGVGKALDTGVALVPEERRAQGVMLGASIQDNIAIANLDAVSSSGIVSLSKIADLAKTSIENLRIKTRGPRQYVGQLSGGNQQKVVLAKVLARRPSVLLLDEPTRGIDVGTKEEIYRLIRELAAQGTCVVAVSSELPELIGMSDRIVIMKDGMVSGVVPAESADEELLLSYCYGRAA